MQANSGIKHEAAKYCLATPKLDRKVSKHFEHESTRFHLRSDIGGANVFGFQI